MPGALRVGHTGSDRVEWHTSRNRTYVITRTEEIQGLCEALSQALVFTFFYPLLIRFEVDLRDLRGVLP